MNAARATNEPADWTGPRLFRRIATAGAVLAVAGWLGLVLDYQYRVPWLSHYDVATDGIFLVGVAAIALGRSLERWGPARVQGVVLRLAFSLTLFAAALVVAEFAVRAIVPGVRAGVPPTISLNSLGFREREIGPKGPGRYRIIVIGDSFTFGNGIEEGNRFSNLLQGFLGPGYEVLNLGHPGNNLPDHLLELDQALKMMPDFVLLQLYENDFETPNMAGRRPQDYPFLPSDLDTWIERTSVLYRMMIDHWNQLQEAAGLSEGYTRYMARHLRDPQSPEAVQTSGMLLQFIERARVDGVPSGGVLFPALYGLRSHGANYPFDYLHDRVKQIYTSSQAPYLDLLPAFSTVNDPPSLWVSRFDAHPNAKANRLAATAILNRFLSVWQH